MQTSARGRALIAQREGVRLKAYTDSVGVWTIGVGHTSSAGPPHVSPGMTITAAEVQDILASDLAKFEATINAAIKAALADHEFDALSSLAFNIGQGAFSGSTVAHKLNAGDRHGAADAFLMWKNSGGKPILLKRRQSERLQFLTPYSGASA